MPKVLEDPYGTFIEGPMQSRPVWAELVCPPNSNVVQCASVVINVTKALVAASVTLKTIKKALG